MLDQTEWRWENEWASEEEEEENVPNENQNRIKIIMDAYRRLSLSYDTFYELERSYTHYTRRYESVSVGAMHI